MVITFKNWEKYNPRKDYKNPTWCRLNSDLITHDLWDALNSDELKCYLALLCLATRKHGVLEMTPSTFCRVTALDFNALISAVIKLEKLQVVEVTRTDHVQITNGLVQDLCATNERTNERTPPNKLITTHIDNSFKANNAGEPATQTLPAVAIISELSALEEGVLRNTSEKVQRAWLKNYNADFVMQEVRKADLWIVSNSHKAPKTNFAAFFTRWIAKSWEDQRKGFSNKPKKQIIMKPEGID